MTRKKERFIPIKKNSVKMYTCGPTVYNYPHIGNLRTFIFEDVLKRALEYNGYQVNHVMNITDVGHLTNDRDMGEEKIEKEAKKEGKTAWQIAEFYTEAFKNDLKNLNIVFPTTLCKATDNIKEQIEMIKTLEKKGYVYKTSDGVYFDTSKVEDYAKLSHQNIEELKEGARIEANTEKRNPTDFALWKFSKTSEQRQMEWPSPWGVGFPGWHIECSAMSMKYLGDHFDIHCGGIDAINIHHTNEIAQSEATTGKKPWVNYWLHGAFLNVSGGEKMAKSSGNFLTLNNSFIDKGIDPLVYRFSTFMTHYRKPMEWSYDILANAKNGFDSLMEKISKLTETHNSTHTGQILTNWKDKFTIAINDDLNMPQALATLNELLKADETPEDKMATILDFDRVLGLNLHKIKVPVNKGYIVFYGNTPNTEIVNLIEQRTIALLKERELTRKNKDWKKSDELRDKIKELGFDVKDTPSGQEIKRI